MRNNIRGFIIGGFLASGLGALAVNIPFTFSAGSAIKASDINANFSSLKTAVDKLETNGTSVKVPLVLSNNANEDTLTAKNAGSGYAFYAESKSGGAIHTVSKGTGLYAASDGSDAILGVSSGENVFAVHGVATGNQSNGLYGESRGARGTGVVGRGGIQGGYFEALNDSQPDLDPAGVTGIASKNRGIGVRGLGSTWGGKFSGSIGLDVEGDTGIIVRSKNGGSTLSLTQNGNGTLINGRMSNGNSFVVLANGTVETSGNVVAKGVTLVSDRNAKTNFSSINALEVLNKVVQLPVSRWNYKSDASSLKHIGPMAQDFHKAFNLNGSDDTHVSAVDMQGVAFAAIQGLNLKLETENATLRASLATLEARLSKLEQK
jgi:Chaperone of endosialidase